MKITFLLIMILSVQLAVRSQQPLLYLPLGDSYTICEGLAEDERWPDVLVKELNRKGYTIELAGNHARTGYTTEDLIHRELPFFDEKKPDIVTLLIGVNDYVRGKDSSYFHRNLVKILDHLQKGLPDKQNIILIAIPDYSVTPGGKLYASGRNVSKDLLHWNTIIKEEAHKRKLVFADIYPLTQEMGKDTSLVSADGLHPSAREVRLWEQLIEVEMQKLLTKKQAPAK